jgi:hypothetical protein
MTGYKDIKTILGWILGRFLAAVIVFQLLGLGAPFNPELSAWARLVAVAAIPGSIEIPLYAAMIWSGDF